LLEKKRRVWDRSSVADSVVYWATKISAKLGEAVRGRALG
jgi:hypothetical protein